VTARTEQWLQNRSQSASVSLSQLSSGAHLCNIGKIKKR